MKKLMMSTAVITVIATILMAVLFVNFEADILFSLAITFGTIAYHFVMRLLVGGIVDTIMHNRADYNKKWYQLRPFEEKLYKKLKVKNWKKKMPTYEPELFDVKKHTFDEIAQAMCQAEVVHEVIVVFSFLPLITVPVFGSFWVFLITSLLSACLDLSFVIMQRYNRPRIIKLIKK
ncbi:MAG: hypothetical protein E7261_01815 [Lachnospiraceae bacterium]|nr:hypothetical protein [Lachnospiraceae bacterium]